jgi:hypothetical protein
MRRGRPRPARLDPIPDARVPPNWGIKPAILGCSRHFAVLGSRRAATVTSRPRGEQGRPYRLVRRGSVEGGPVPVASQSGAGPL